MTRSGQKTMRLHTLAISLLTLLLTSPLSARELQPDRHPLTQVEIAGVMLIDQGTPVVLLATPEENQVIPIFIGLNEARAIHAALQDEDTPRPLTHELASDLIPLLQAQLERIIIDDLVDGAYLGFLHLRQNGHNLYLDSRPSDALALGLRAGASIHVSPAVMASAIAIHPDELEIPVVTARGISVSPINAELRLALNLPEHSGVLVTQVRDEGQESALKAGQLLTHINGDPTPTPMEFLRLMRRHERQPDLQLTFWQEQRQQSIQLQQPERQRTATSSRTPHVF